MLINKEREEEIEKMTMNEQICGVTVSDERSHPRRRRPDHRLSVAGQALSDTSPPHIGASTTKWERR